MIFRYFRQNNRILFILLPILLIGISLFKILILKKAESNEVFDSAFYLFSKFIWLRITINTVLITISAFLLNLLYNNNGFYERNNYIISFIFALISFIFVGLSAPILLYLLILLNIGTLYLYFEALKIEKTNDKLFKISLIQGIISVFLPVNLVLGFSFFLVLVWKNGFTIRRVLTFLLGIMTPFIYLFTYQFVFDYKIRVLNQFTYYLNNPKWINYGFYICIFLCMLFFLVSYRINKYKSIQFKKHTFSLLFIFFFGVTIVVLFTIFKITLINTFILLYIPIFSILFSIFNLTKSITLISDLILLSMIILYIFSVS